jgi:hypothetical protein
MTLIYSKEKWAYGGSRAGWQRVSASSKIQNKSITSSYWSKVSAKEFIYPLPYYVSTDSDSTPFWTRHYYGSSSGSHLHGYNTTLLYGMLPWVRPKPNYGDLRSKLLGKLNQAEINVPVALLEADKAFSLVQQTTVRLARSFRNVRRGQFSRAADELGITLSQRKRKRLNRRFRIQTGRDMTSTTQRIDQFSRNWLEFRYGWTPLYNDVYNAAQLVSGDDKSAQKKKDFIKINTHESVETDVSSQIAANPFLGDYEVDGVGSVAKGKHGIGVFYREVDELARYKAKLGLNNPYLVAWELIPLSFVVDWFIPVGNAIKSLTAYAGLEFVAGYEWWSEECEYRNGGITFSNWKGTLTSQDPSVWKENSFERKVLTSFDDLRVSIFQTSHGMNAVRTLDAITLLQRLVGEDISSVGRTVRI